MMFAPLGALPLVSVGKITSVTASASTTIALAFSVSGLAGNYTPMSATVELTLGTGTAIKVEQAISATIPLRFGGDPDLRVAGKPFEVFALPQSYTTRAAGANYTVKAVYQNFTARAVR